MGNRLINIDALPSEEKESLVRFLTDEEQSLILKEQLYNSAIIIDNGEYQISIRSIEELYEIIEHLHVQSESV